MTDNVTNLRERTGRQAQQGVDIVDVNHESPIAKLTYWASIVHSVIYTGFIVALLVRPGTLYSHHISFLSEYWGVIGGMYMVGQVLPFVAGAYDSSFRKTVNLITSGAPIAALVFAIISPTPWGYWETKIALVAGSIALADLLLAFAHFRRRI